MNFPFDDDPALPFRPVSLDDFSTYAKNVSWLIGLPYQKSQAFLAKLYGYSGYHELQQIMKKTGEPGPFDGPARNHRVDEADGDYAQITTGQFMAREHRIWDVVQEMPEYYDLVNSKGVFKLKDIGLFDEPAIHRQLFGFVKGVVNVANGAQRAARDATVHDYATLVCRDDGECFIPFTKEGKMIFDAANDCVPDPYRTSYEDRLAYETRLQEMADAYPQNPWVVALWLYNNADLHWQDDWTSNWDSKQNPFNADEERMEQGLIWGNRLYPYARRAIKQFETLYQGRGKDAPNPKLAAWGFEHDVDCFYWPAMLFIGGMIALNAGKYEQAYKWFMKCWKIQGSDGFGARYYVAILRLIRGKGSVSKALIHPEYGRDTRPIASLAFAFDAFIKKQFKEAKMYFAEAIKSTWAVLTVFTYDEVPELESLRQFTNVNTPAAIQEFLWHVMPLRDERYDVDDFFCVIAEQPEVIQATIALHRAADDMSFKEGEKFNPVKYSQGELKVKALSDTLTEIIMKVDTTEFEQGPNYE
ncbi:hypothetical protein [Neptuniibacter sp. QD37_11]|uniref:hypothetical protein n=1 Tax=Neptuniibacter sp. QD37_11 TaxID=3398209 RepID=UPI0039F615A4